MAHLNGLDLGRKRLSHKDRLFKVLEGDFLSSLTLLDQITREFHHGWWICSQRLQGLIAGAIDLPLPLSLITRTDEWRIESRRGEATAGEFPPPWTRFNNCAPIDSIDVFETSMMFESQENKEVDAVRIDRYGIPDRAANWRLAFHGMERGQQNGILFEPAKVAGSTGVKVLIEWTPKLRNVVERLRVLKRADITRWMFTTQGAQKFTYSGASTAWKRAVKRAGVRGVTFHDLKAKALTDVDDLRGMNDAQKMGGHSTQTQTADYVRHKKAKRTGATR